MKSRSPLPGPEPSELRFGAAPDCCAPRLAALAAEAFGPGAWTEAAFAEELGRARTRAFTVDVPDGAPVGYIVGWRVLDEYQLLSLAVDSAWRRRGVARRLLGYGFDALRREGVRRVTLEVREGNEAARLLYAATGFAVEGRRPRYYAGGEAAVLLGRSL